MPQTQEMENVMHKYNLITAFTLIANLGFISSPLQAQTILLNDTFDVGGATVGDDAPDPLDTAWYRADSNAGLPGLSVAPDSGSNALFVDTTNTGQPFVGSFSAVALTNISDYVELSGTYRTDNQVGGGIRFGLFNDNGTPTLANNDGSANDDNGYKLNLGTPTGAGIGTTSLTVDMSAGEVATADSIITSVSSGADDDGLVHNWSFRITRTGANELTLFGEWDGSTNGTTTITTSVASDLITTFNEVAISWGGSGAGEEDYYVDDITVTTNVPEPSNIAIALGSTVMMLVVVSRRFKRGELKSTE